MVQISRERFEELVGDALDSIPPGLIAAMDNVVVLVEEEPPDGDGQLLGVYDGTPLPERDSYSVILPDRITIFRGPLMRLCADDAQIVEEVRITVIHEIAHHFGIDDERLSELGYG